MSSVKDVEEVIGKKTAKEWIKDLKLEPHPIMENGYFKESFRDVTKVKLETDEGEISRSSSSLIYYLHMPVEPLCGTTLFYQLKCSSVMMHFYDGSPCKLYYMKAEKSSGDEDGTSLKLETIRLGSAGSGDVPHAVITKGTWFTRILESEENDGDKFTLVGVTVAPGFEYTDLKTVSYESLLQLQVVE